ncbi:BolA family protein [Abyssibacter profundi]|uniref:BolA family transcriptional regulator n=1 Tax=Abyssibacter profundi TaxID=2182787 RepID=A0A363UMX9_9GAMM|nr:BolA family protein [Abyssibacter profundi]MBV60389.1 BolA family transcriptional regulator [Nevskiales bacterium]PWN56795.1 BolA family transcriptional regulator [Abyssibacter profundi]
MKSAEDRIAEIRTRLESAFDPYELAIQDDSHLHVGHAGARSGKGHFTVRIRASSFEGQAPLARHRAVYAALGQLMDTDIHALAIDAAP